MTRQRGGRYRAGMREDVCSAYSEWLRLRTVPAERILASREAPAAVRRADGSAYPADIAPRASQSKMTGDMAITALKAVLSSAAENGDKVVRLVCSYDCRQGEQCHGATLVEEATALIAGQHSQRDKREAEDYEQQHGSTGHGSDGGPSSGSSGASGGATASGSRGRGSTAGRDSTAAQGGGRRQEQQPGAAEAPTERKKRRGTQASSRKRQLLAGMQAAAAAAQLRDSAE